MEEPRTLTSVWVPPESHAPPPIQPHPQILPLNELSWELFQSLCCRLAQRFGDVERCQEYGISGQPQEGVDIYVRKLESSKYSVWQCKRHQSFDPSLIEKAVTDFLSGSWASKTDEFVLAVTVRMENTNLVQMIEAQGNRLREQKIRFLPLGIVQISERLKDNADLVEDFFGREWARIFCDEEAVQRLSSRLLTPAEVIRLRSLLRQYYKEHFEVTDPGLRSFADSINPEPISLVDRFVPPDILEEQQVFHTPEILEEQQVASAEVGSYPLEDQEVQRRFGDAATEYESSPPSSRSTTRKVRRSAIEWLSDSDLSVIIGEPGIGKSTLLRCLLLDLLSSEPRYEIFARRWGQYLPVWVPFASWTRLVSEAETGCSLLNVLTTWLRKVGAEEELIKLVERALEDSRLLLFVDGLDEWSNETTARTTLTLLETFVRARKVPAVATSRPQGYARIGSLSGSWRKSSLAKLTREQQQILAERWFLYRATAADSPGEDGNSIAAIQTRAKADAAKHIKDLHRDNRISRLAGVPLLLNALVALAIRRQNLPRSRFKAYEELTHLLLREHPKHRESAVHARHATTGRLSEENRERALAHLAWETHGSLGSDVLEKTVAREVLQDFCSSHLQKSDGEALEIADELLGIGVEAIGILVEKSSVEIGFLHRSFQEFLAAKHLSSLSFEQQKEVLKERFPNPQWSDVLLCLCHLNSRVGQVDTLVEIVECMDLPAEREFFRRTFLAEIAFGDLHCSAGTAKRVAEKTFEIIETGTFERTRERLLELALDGLESTSLRPVVASRIHRWYPLRYYYRHGFYEAVGTWPKCNETLSILWRGLLDEEDWNRRAAAESLAKVYGGDPCVAKLLFELLLKPSEPRLPACVLHALCLGWGTDPRLRKILRDAQSSTDSTLKSVASIHRTKRNEHDMKDRYILVDLSRMHRSASWLWRDDRIRALIVGWPSDLKLKKQAIESVTNWRYPNNAVFDSHNAGMLLLEGFPQDDEVAEVIAHLFRTEDHPGLLLGLDGDWGALVEGFAGNQTVGEAVDDWIEKNFKRLIWDFQLCLISRSKRAKGFLLQANDETGIITEYQALWLLQGWGMEDEEAAATLVRFANSDTAKNAPDLLPDILCDNEQCRVRLLEILSAEPAFRVPHVLNGLIKLGASECDEEVIETAMGKLSGEILSDATRRGRSILIEYFPNHPIVRKMAGDQLHHLGGTLNAVARVYGSEVEIRRKVIELCSSFPAHLRLIIVDRLSRLGPEDDVAHGILSHYDEDIDVNVKTAGAIGYVKSVKQRGTVPSVLVEKLTEGLHVIGRDFPFRRQAAFSALLGLDRLDIVRNVWSEDAMKRLTFGSGPQTNLQLANHLIRHWDRVSRAFGEGFWERADWVPDEFLTEMAAYTKDPELSDDIIDRLVKGDREGPTPQLLRLCSRKWRGTQRLRELCTTIVHDFRISSWIQTAPGIVAAEILAEQFADDSETFTMLKSLVIQRKISSALVIALGAGWSNSQAWKQLCEQVKTSRFLLPAHFYILATNTLPDEFVTTVSTELAMLRGDIWEFPRSCSRAVAVRFARDKQVRELAFARLEAQPTSIEKINFPSFLLENDDQPERLRNWIRSEIKQQSESEVVAEIAINLSTGTFQSVGHVLSDHLVA